MATYLFFALYVHYILKPISNAMFLDQKDIDDLPYLYILIAAVGGLLATLYTKLAIRTSLKIAVAGSTVVSVVFFIAFWALFPLQIPGMVWVFNLWASLFGCVMVAQGYLVAGNLFTSREAKRLYPIIGLGAVAGSGVGSLTTALASNHPLTLVLACAPLVSLAYVAFRLAIARDSLSLASARGAEAEEPGFSAREALSAIAGHRHLQVITGIIAFMFVVDQLVDYQLKAAAKLTYVKGTEKYASFFGTYYLIQNVFTFLLQFVVTGAVVRRLGVGGTLKLMPGSIAAASGVALFWPGVLSAALARLTEAGSRYSFNKTGTELLYLPLPAELRNRTKAFMDVTVDRTSRGLAGVLLLALGWVGLKDPSKLPLLVIGFTIAWIWLARHAEKEYLVTIRKRLQVRRLDLESARVAVSDPALLSLLEQTARGSNARQAAYALSVLSEAPGYRLDNLLEELAHSPLAPVRARVYDLARAAKFPGLLETALAEIRSGERKVLTEAISYVLALSPDAAPLAREFLDHSDPAFTESTLAALAGQPQGLGGLVPPDTLHRLLHHPCQGVAAAACRAAGALQDRAYIQELVPMLGMARLRGAAVEALAAYGTRVCGTLGDILEDESAPVAIRRHLPRALRRIEDQRSVDVLLRSIGQPNLGIRGACIRALNGLREAAPSLDYGPAFVTRQVLNEAKHYFELNAALEPLRDQKNPRTAGGLLASSIDEQLKQTLERLFRLLGLRYPPKEIYAAYLAVNRGPREQFAAALEFLDNVLDRDLKRILLPMLEDTVHLAERGRTLFHLEAKTPRDAIRDLLHSGDGWLVACSMAAAAELKLRDLSPDIADVSREAGAELCEVGRAAAAALA